RCSGNAACFPRPGGAVCCTRNAAPFVPQRGSIFVAENAPPHRDSSITKSPDPRSPTHCPFLPFCVIVNTLEPILIVPVRDVLLGLTEYSTLPGPVPPSPDVIAIQSALLIAVQEQLLAAVTLMAPVPPPFLNALPPGLIVVEQAPSCDMVTIQSAIAIVPVLGGPLLGATVNVTVPGPLSELRESIE